jgi:nucleoside-diphosphate-sugar epimerase
VNLLVTGGSGFVGTALVDLLLEKGHHVRILDERPFDAPRETGKRPEPDELIGDIRDQSTVDEALRDVDRVFHLAARVPLTRAGSEFDDVNVGGTRTLLEGAAAAGVKHVVHLSSSAIFGVPKSLPITEDSPTNPLGSYGRSKLTGEQLALTMADESDIPLAVIRPRTIVGTTRLGIFQMLFDMIANDRPIRILGSGDHLFQLLSNRDLARAMWAISDSTAKGIFNVGADEFGTMRDDLNALASRAGSQSQVQGIPAWIARPALAALDFLRLSPLVDWHYKTVDKAYWFDCARIRDELGWVARDSNRDMLFLAYEWYMNEGDRSLSRGLSTHKAGISRGILRFLTGPTAAGRNRTRSEMR